MRLGFLSGNSTQREWADRTGSRRRRWRVCTSVRTWPGAGHFSEWKKVTSKSHLPPRTDAELPKTTECSDGLLPHPSEMPPRKTRRAGASATGLLWRSPVEWCWSLRSPINISDRGNYSCFSYLKRKDPSADALISLNDIKVTIRSA